MSPAGRQVSHAHYDPRMDANGDVGTPEDLVVSSPTEDEPQPKQIDPLIPVEAPPSWEVAANVAPNVCYAMAHNRTPILHSLRVTGTRPPTSKQLVVVVSSAWARDGRSPLMETSFSIEAPHVGQSVVISPVREARLDDIAIADLETLVPAEISIRIHDEAGAETTALFNTNIYARNQWLNDSTFMDVTAAFVQPNHPDVQGILSAASASLTAQGLSGALSGYQGIESGQHHVVAQAIFEELQRRVDNYINPPPTYEAIGQQIRPLDQVLHERQGTCIDLACAYAACLEAAGLYPVIFMVKGHAFSGYITARQSLNRTYIDSWAEVQNLLDSGLVVGVETVCLTDRSSWATALAGVRPRLLEAEMEGILDVFQTHRSGVRPLPARVQRGNELVIVIDNGPSEPPVIERRDPVTRHLLPDSVPARVQSWKNSLLDLSFRNRLLNLNLKNSGLRLLPPLGQLGYIEDRLTNGDALQIAPSDLLNAVQLNSIPEGRERAAQHLGDELWREALHGANTIFSTFTTEQFRTRVSRLRSDSRVIEEESGANNLFLALGSVKWGPSYGDYTSPIFLLPLRMKMGRGDRFLQIGMDETQSTVPNYCLIEALRARERLSLQWFADDMSDDLGLDVEQGLQALRTEFRERGLDARGFSVELSASVAMLDFKKFRLWRDMSDHWKEFAKQPVVKHLIETPRLSFQDPGAVEALPAVNDTALLTPQPADGSQIRAIARSLAGQSFVLEGPPGTGKSQTITNLLANAMHQGKRVLFVAEKQAALSVVHERLEAVGLGPYCLELHDRGTKPEALRTQLKHALETQPVLDQREFEQLEDEFASVVRQLDQYRRGLYEPNEVGFSFAAAYHALAQLGFGAAAEVTRSVLRVGKAATDDIRRRLLGIADLTVPAQVRPDHPWGLAGATSFESIDRNRLAQLIELLTSQSVELGALSDKAGLLVAGAQDHEQLATVAALLALVETQALPKQAEWAAIGSDEWLAKTSAAIAVIRSQTAALTSTIAGHEDVARRSDLEAIAAATADASTSFVLGRKGRVRGALGDLLGVFDESTEVAVLAQRVQSVAVAATAIQSAYSDLRSCSGLSLNGVDLPVAAAQVDAIAEFVARLTTAARLVQSSSALGDLARVAVASGGFPAPGLARKVDDLSQTLQSLTALVGGDLSTESRWSASLGVVGRIGESARTAWTEDRNSGTYLRLQRWLNLQLELAPLRSLGLSAFCSQVESGVVEGDQCARAFDRGLLETTMQVRAEEMNLDVFDRVQHDRRVKRLIELLDARRKMAKAAIPFGLSGNRKVHTGVGVGKVGEFKREVSRPGRGRGKSIRHLIATYPEIVSDLTPCFLMSPDSVAQFVPPGSIEFDIAVFDEASQVTVADAIGVIGRAKAVIIVGDSRQMPPSKIGAFTGSEEDDVFADNDAELVDEESILVEALEAGFDQEWLSWHYRSQDESLINFSNVYYYESRLATFPAPADARPDCGIFYRQVAGQFDHGATRTNLIEAQAVVEELIKRLDDPVTAELSYGVITLNMQQRHLIESILDTHAHLKVRELRDVDDAERRLFVLNLENVQGRERDVILMGTSFSKRIGGGPMPLSFGPLANIGGEKRLNVAVTRAKRQFVVVSSFDPTEMREPSSLGLIHLRDYLLRAQRRSQGAFEESNLATNDSAAEQGSRVTDLAARLRERGLRVEVRRGMSAFKVDLALSLPELPDRWLVAVLIDGSEWNSRTLVADRDALPTLILKDMMGWPRVARVWLPSWIIEPAEVIEDLIALAHSAALDPDPATVAVKPVADPPTSAIGTDVVAPPVRRDPPAMEAKSDSAPPKVVAAPQLSPLRVVLAGEEEFVAVNASTVIGTVEQLEAHDPAAHALAAHIVHVEGPLPEIAVRKRVANAFGLSRVAAKRLDDLAVFTRQMVVSEHTLGAYVWPSHRAPDAWRGFRLTTSEQRVIVDIAPEELINYMEAITRVSLGISRTELVDTTAKAFGRRSITREVSDHLDLVIDLALERGRLVDDGTITVP